MPEKAVAMGLSTARRAALLKGTPKNASAALKKQAKREAAQTQHPRTPDPRRSRAMKKALKRKRPRTTTRSSR